jgi:NitT/TauT family transport system substrate-binding protein
MLGKMGARLAATGTLLAAAIVAQGALAQEAMKIAAGQRGNWDSSVPEIGERAGIMKKHGLKLEILYTQGSGETQQAVISGAVDVGVAIGTLGAIGAYSKGAPIRIIGAQSTGAGDLYWYARPESGITAIAGNAGKTIAFSTNGSSTQTVVRAFIEELGAKATPTATGSPSSTLTQVMSGQVDIGWAAPPFGIDLLDQGKIKKLATGNDTSLKDQTVRVLATSVDKLKTKKDSLDRFVQAYRDTVDYMYTNPEVMKVYSDWLNISPELARRTRDDFFARDSIDPDNMKGLDKIVQDAVTFKFASAPLTKEQLADLIQIPKPVKK